MSMTTVRAGQLLLSDMLFLAAAGVVVVRLLVGNDRDLTPADGRRTSPLVLVGALLLLTGGAVSSLRSWTPVESMSIVLRFVWITLVWFWTMRAVCRDRYDLARLLRGWKATALISAGAAILGQLGIAFVSELNGDRQTALAGHPNNLGAQLTAVFVLILLAVPRSTSRSPRRARAWWLLSLGLVTTAVFATGSMTALFAIATSIVAAGAAFLLSNRPERARRRRSPLAPMFVMVGLAAGLIALATSDLAVVERISLFREGNSYVVSSVDSRGERNSIVTNRFDDFLVSGMGLSTDAADDERASPDDESVRNYGVHNMYLGLLYQAGLPATLGAVLILVTAARQLGALLHKVDADLHLITIAIAGSLTAVVTTSMFQPVQYDRFFWMPVAMTGCLWSLRRRELATAAGTDVQLGSP